MCNVHYQRWLRLGDVNAKVAPRHSTRGLRGTPEYRAWVQMRQRCNNKRMPDYKYYGGRGISVCKRWSLFANFLKDMGKRPTGKHTLDRKRVNGNYTPRNCRWATRAQQSRNRRPFTVDGFNHPKAKHIVFDGIIDTIGGWARKNGFAARAISARLERNWDPIRAITEPMHRNGKNG